MSGGRLTRRGFVGAALAAPALLDAQISNGRVKVWRGIRYGWASRFQAPVAQPFVFTAGLEFGNVSPQKAITAQPQSDDCHYLNVWTPAADKARRPVMVYIHGGAYSNGTGNDPLTDGARLAERGDVVVVTVTHRLNAFGYLSLGRIMSCYPDSGNGCATISTGSAATRATSPCSASQAAAQKSRP